MLAAPEEAPHQGFHRAIVEILRQLNRDEMEEPQVPGLEVDELRTILSRKSFPLITRTEARQAVDVLLTNGLAREINEPKYAWTRGRVVGDRVTITTQGKTYLLQSVRRVGRV